MKFSFRYARRARIRFALASLIVVAAAVLAPLAARGQFVNTKISGKQAVIRNVIILPAKVEIVRTGLKGPEGMAAESEELSTRIEKTLAEVLANQKKILTLGGPATSSDGGAQAKYAMADIQAKFDDLLPKVMKKRGDVNQGRFTIGDEVLNLNLDKSSDAIVFIRGQGQKITSGKAAFNMMVGGVPAYLRLQIAIVDAHSGEVLYYADPVLGGDPTAVNDHVRKALEKAVKKLPIP
jgi:hypothetical protein